MSLDKIVKQVVESHFETEQGLVQIVWFPDPQGKEIRLIEVNRDTLPTGEVQTFRFAPSQEVPLPIRVADVTPEEWERIEKGQILLPDEWRGLPRRVFLRKAG